MDIRAITSPVVHDREALEEFADSLLDKAPQVAAIITRVRKHPEDREGISTLFRTMNSIKGDAALTKIELGVAIIHPIESILARARNEHVHPSELLTEVILLAIDRLELAVEALLHQKPLHNLQLLVLVQGLEKIALASQERIDSACGELIERVTGFPPIVTSKLAGHTPHTGILDENQSIARDLQFFRRLATQFESRSPLFKGRTMRILRLALETNKVAGNPVNPIQLEAALYTHDLGMMFLPESTWLKVERMNREEKLALQAHPGYAAAFLERMNNWQEAAQMVLQHHEMSDGHGYPEKLRNEEICPGAKIIAIVDAFEAVMLRHIHRGKNRSVLRAIAEVNACDTQFSPEWIKHFNTVIRRTFEAHP